MGKVNIGPGKAEAKQVIQPEIVERIVYVDRIVEVAGPETVVYVDKPVEKIVIKEIPVEVIKEVEKIVEIPKIKIVEKPYEVVKEVYNIEHTIKEKLRADKLQKKLHIAQAILALTYVGVLFCLM